MRYVNPYQRKVSRGFSHFLLWRMGYYKEWTLPPPIPESFSYPNPLEMCDPHLPCATWVNHSTFWVRAFGKSLLVDPIWSDRCSPLPFFGPKRLHPPKPQLDQISPLDVVLITHNHYDHLDRFTIKKLHTLNPQTLWLIPKGVRRWFRYHLPKARVHELSWWEQFSYKEMTFTSVPAQHFSGRGLFDRNRTLWMGFVVEFAEGKRVYFVGDTGYNPYDFKEIQKKFTTMDLSTIPIGVYKPRIFMKPVHIAPEEAVHIHCDVASKLSIASHWGTFRLSSEEIDRPPYDLFHALDSRRVSAETFRVLQPGQSINW